MGNTVTRAVTKPFRSFNVESRAQKQIMKDKPVLSPRYPTSIDPTLPPEEREKVIAKIQSKSGALDERLRGVKVVSEGINPEVRRDTKKLPQIREIRESAIYGFVEPKIVPKGKLTFTQTMELLTKHYNNPKAYRAEDAAKEYHLEVRDVEIILEYHMPLTLLDPDDANDMKRLGLPTVTEMLKEPQ